MDHPHWMTVNPRPESPMRRGRGSYIEDEAGKRYLDFIQGWAVNCLGHCPEVLVRALQEQAAELIHCSPAFHNRPALELAERIGKASFGGQVWFGNSGAEANEGAIKLARKWGASRGAFEIITVHGSFHGRTLATMSASGKAPFKPLFEPKVPGFHHVPLGDLGAVEAAINSRTVGVMLEPVLGEGGVWPAGAEFLQGLRRLTQERNVLLIADEVQTGVGRTGTAFGYQQAGIEPDLMTLGKGLGGGLPIAALVARPEFCVFETGDQGSTFGGNPLMAAGALAVFDAVTEPSFLAGVVERGQRLRAGLSELAVELELGAVRGQGLLLALELPASPGAPAPNAAAVVVAARQAGLLLNAPTPTAIRLMPALNLSFEEIEEGLRLLRQALTQVPRTAAA